MFLTTYGLRKMMGKKRQTRLEVFEDSIGSVVRGLVRRWRIARYRRAKLMRERRDRNSREHLVRLQRGIPDRVM
jgi:hypothetical protein